MTSLVNLDLSFNRIETIQSSLFADLRNLIDLNLNSNTIKVIEDGSIMTLTFMQRLHSNESILANTTMLTFKGIYSIKSIDIAPSMLDDFEHYT
jgi:Leucine-rich repeat (LRR) protein